MIIRAVDPVADLALVEEMYRDAADYWQMERGPHRAEDVAAEFFTSAPPGCDPALSHRLGLFAQDRLAGVAELSFGFPAAGDPYLGLMVFAQWARGVQRGETLLKHIETLARAAGCTQIFLGVLDKNHLGREFWEREGFRATGLSGTNAKTGNLMHRLGKQL